MTRVDLLSWLILVGCAGEYIIFAGIKCCFVDVGMMSFEIRLSSIVLIAFAKTSCSFHHFHFERVHFNVLHSASILRKHYWNFQKLQVYLNSFVISCQCCFAVPSLIEGVCSQFSILFITFGLFVEKQIKDFIIYLIDRLKLNWHFEELLFAEFNEMFEFLFFNSINFDCCLLLLAPAKSMKLLQFTNFLFLALILHFQDLCHPESIKALEFFHPQSLAS